MTQSLTDAEKIERIRTLNDMARQNPGVACRANMTLGFAALSDHDRHAAMREIIAFNQFTEANDPHGEHDCALIYRLVTGEWVQQRPEREDAITQSVIWKIDCYDTALEYGSEAPWDAAQTVRVLTVMLGSEY